MLTLKTTANQSRRHTKLWLLSLAVCFSVGYVLSCAEDPPRLTGDVERLVKVRVNHLIAKDFPDLSRLNIEYLPVTEDDDTVFFETYVKVSTAFRLPEDRTYQILANERLSKNRPDDGAIIAILAHELFHIRDYMKKNVWQLYRLKGRYKDNRFRRQYERYTDQRTLYLGYGPGLLRYRKWLYGAIKDPHKVKEKQDTYMTPEEITSWLARKKDMKGT